MLKSKLICAALALVLAGCGSMPGTVVTLKPPVDLLQDCIPDYVEVRTNGDLVARLSAYAKALALCNNDKAALRLWSDKE